MDIILTGAGSSLRECRELLVRAGFEVGKDLSEDERCPVILGDVPHLFSQALQLVEAGRHLLIANPMSLSASQLASLLASRKPRQALFLWSERRQHPAYRLVAGLVRADESGWHPRYIRQAAFSVERPTGALLRWRACESLAIAIELAGSAPESLSAFRAMNPARGSLDFLTLALYLGGVEAFLQVGLGEGMDRYETVLAAHERKAYVDELNARVPVRLVDDGESALASGRWVSCASPSRSELARQQCLAFLEGATSPERCQSEGDTWLRVMSCWQAVEASVAAQGAVVAVTEPAAPALRAISRRGARHVAATPPVKVVS